MARYQSKEVDVSQEGILDAVGKLAGGLMKAWDRSTVTRLLFSDSENLPTVNGLQCRTLQELRSRVIASVNAGQPWRMCLSAISKGTELVVIERRNNQGGIDKTFVPKEVINGACFAVFVSQGGNNCFVEMFGEAYSLHMSTSKLVDWVMREFGLQHQ